MRICTFEEQHQFWTSRVRRLKSDATRIQEHKRRLIMSTAPPLPTTSTDPQHIPNDPQYFLDETVHSNQCLHCGTKGSLRINTSKNTQHCSKCFREEPCSDVVASAGDRPKTSKQNHYYPEHHWNEALNFAQGMRCGPVSPEIVPKTLEVLDFKYGIRIEDVPKIPHQLVADVLKELKYKPRSKQGVLIWCQITGRNPERLTIEEFVVADRYFKVYFRHAYPVITQLNIEHRLNRKSLLNYNYLANKIFELLELHDPRFGRHKKWYKLLEGDDKIWVQDLIWKGVCERAGWEFIPTN